MSERVLMIDDDAAFARMLAEYLVRPERSGPEEWLREIGHPDK